MKLVPNRFFHSFLFSFIKVIALVALVRAPAFTEDLVLIKDINANDRAIRISKRCLAGSNEFLIADDGLRGMELWLGDGLAGSTRILKDINTGSGDGVGTAGCVVLGNSILFVADDQLVGDELWRSDGTPEGTLIVKDIRSGSGSSSPSNLIILGNSVLFSADDGTNGRELWISDGSESGTVLLKDIYSGMTASNPSSLVKLNDTTVVFSASTSAEGNELWKTDGTGTGTVIIDDLVSGTSSSSPDSLTSFNNMVFFSATSAGTGREPWVTDGTSGNTFILADLISGATNGFYNSFRALAVVNNKVVFTGRNSMSGYEPFVTDGTPGGTGILQDIESGSGNSLPVDYFELGNKVIFSATTSSLGTELYSTDGTTAGTSLLADINPGTGNGTELSEAKTLTSGSPLVFRGGVSKDSATRAYATDGSTVTLLTDLFPGATRIYLNSISPATSTGLTFGLPSPVSSIPNPGLFLSDGTAGGTITHPGTLSGFTESSVPIPMAELNGKLIFSADDGVHGMELWSTDGTEAGTVRITDINEGIASSVIPAAGFAVLNEELLFVASESEHGGELWKTDGTAAGTALLKDIETGTSSAFFVGSSTQHFYLVNSKVVFAATTASAGRELWMSDGTSGGTSIISDIGPGTDSGLGDSLRAAVSSSVIGPTLFFVANNGTNGEEVWATTTSVTGITSDLENGMNGSSPSELTAIPFGADFFGVMFRACPTATGCEVFITTGGAPSNIDVVSGMTGSNPSDFTFVSPSRVFFKADTAAEGKELWKSDASFSTANLVKNVVSGAGDFEISEITALNSTTVVFLGCGAGNGEDCELWKSDGTDAGTTIVKDINSGSASSGPTGFGVLNGVAYFLATDGSEAVNAKYFRSDGTEAGTTALTPQGDRFFSTDNLPVPFTPALNTLFFGSFSSAYGYELFKIGEDQCPTDDSKSVPGLCGCGTVDGDADGDGAVDCLEECPTDPSEQEAGECGCGVIETDENANSIADCLDSEVATLTPPKPKIRFKRKKARIKMTARTGVTYELMYRTKKKGKKGSKKAKFKSKQVSTETAMLRLPKKGSVLLVKYRYLVTNSSIVSLDSKVARKARR